MAPTKMQSLISCPNCQSDNIVGSPYCSSCGSPLGNAFAQDGHAPQAAHVAPRAVVNPVALFTSDGQDRNTVRQMYDRASIILTSGETIEYIAVARGSLGHAPDCVIASSKRLMLYRKKALGKVDLDDCYWRDMSSVTLTDVKGGVNIMFNAIQGWHLLIENLPRPQATKLYDVAIMYSERLRNAAQAASTEGVQPAVSVPTSPATSPAPSTTSGLLMPHSSVAAPSTPLLSSMLSGQGQSAGQPSTQSTGSGLRLADPAHSAAFTRNSASSHPTTANAPLYIPTPESVLQNILQNSTLDGDLEAGVPTRPMQWSAAAFQAPAIAEAQPMVLSEEARPHSVADDPTYVKVSSEPKEPVSYTPSSGATPHEVWSYRASGSLDAAGKGHDTEPQMRPAPPLTTLERIAVFTMPSGLLNHDTSSRLSTPLDSNLLHSSDPHPHPHVMSRWPDAYEENTGTFAEHVASAENTSSIEQSENTDSSLKSLAEKISGPLDDTSAFMTTLPQQTDWTLESTGVFADGNYDSTDGQNTERISMSLGIEQLSDSLYNLSHDYRTAPDPQMTDAPETSVTNTASIESEHSPADVELAYADMPPVVEQVEAQATMTPAATAPEPAPAPAHEPEPQADPVSASIPTNSPEPSDMPPLDQDLISVIGYVDTTAPAASGPAPVPVMEQKSTYSEEMFQGGSGSHPTAPMGFDFDLLPVPGSMASGPLLAASSNMNAEMEDVYKNASAMATQRLDFDPQTDPGDRPTSINLTLNSNTQALSTPRPVTNWSTSEVPSVQPSPAPVEEQKKPRTTSQSTSNRTGSSRMAMDDPIAKMKQLKAMLDAGFITDQDYAAKKAEILSRI